MTDFFRFPHTAHLAWLGQGQPRDDKVLSPDEAAELLSGEVVVEEKVDGANLGLSIDDEGEVRAQNRGSWLTPSASHPQFKLLWRWLAPRRERLVELLWPDRMVFGEWCFATHSVRYDLLPDWFLGFDVYDRSVGHFLDTARRDALLADLDMVAVPRLASGRFDVAGLMALLGQSRVGSGPMEGLVVRREQDGWTAARGKLVRAEFVQAIGLHWSRGPLAPNALAIPWLADGSG